MLQYAYFLAKIGDDTAENERHFAEILPKIGNYPTGLVAERGRAVEEDAEVEFSERSADYSGGRGPVSQYPPEGRQYPSTLRQISEGSFSAVSKPILQVNMRFAACVML